MVLTYRPMPPSSPAAASRLSLTCAVAFIMTACGGGGGGGSASGGTEPPAGVSVATITPENQKALAADALDAATDYTLTLLGMSLLLGQQGSAAPLEARSAPLAFASAKFRMLPVLLNKAALDVNETVPCAQGGTLTVQGHVSGSQQLAAGDSLTLTARDCRDMVDNSLATLNGSLSTNVVAGAFDGSTVSYPVHLVFDIVANDFSVSAPGEQVVIAGDQQVDLNEASTSSGTIVVTGKALRTRVTSGPDSRSLTLKDYRKRLVIEPTAATSEVTARAETDSRFLRAFSYDLSTRTPLREESSGAFTSGSLKVVASPSTLLVNVSATDAITLELDGHGDGTFETTTPTTLNELVTYL